MLDPICRGAIVMTAALCVAGAVALAPSRARSSDDSTAARIAAVEPALAPFAVANIAVITVRRNPFADEPARQATPVNGEAAPRTQATLHAATEPHAALAPLPNNLSVDSIPQIPEAPGSTGAAAHISAIVTGAHPYAMVEVAGTNAIKGIGDRIGDSPIVAIDIDGMTLQTGERLTVAPAVMR